ncbi:MAG TPA: hypothetical protein DDW52_22490 [Planctomycetaceae bacterium]|nr:hypothetical protein [Planctomycetaceae bacterium]
MNVILRNPQFRVLSLLLFIGLLTVGDSATAQKMRRRFKPEQQVLFYHLGEWKPATVLQVQGNRVAIQYEFAGTDHQKVLAKDELRYPWEARAITPMRSWSDKEQNFKVRAAGVALTPTTITLLKESDGLEVTVPIDKLSETDQAYLKKRLDEVGPPVAPMPESTVFATQASLGSAVSWNNASTLADVQPDGQPSYASLPMAGVAFPRADFHEDVCRIEPIGGSAGWMAVGTLNSRKPCRILWVSLAEQKIKRLHLIPSDQRLVSVHAPSRQFLTLNNDDNRLTLWEADPNSVVPVGKKSWISSATNRWGGWDIWAEIVTPNRVLHRWGRAQYICWDTEAQREAYRFEQESFFRGEPTLSPGKRYIVLPEDKRIRVLDSSSGNTLASLPVEGGSAAGVGISRDGRHLAVLTRSQLAVWTFGSDEEPRRYRADSIGTPFTARVEWIDDSSLLIDRKTLFDLNHELPLWSYEPKTFEVKRDSFGTRTQTVFNNKLCYTVEFRGQQDGFIVGAVDLPGPMVKEATADLDAESLFIIRPGARVSIKLQCGEFDSEVQAALEQQIADNGWVYDPQSPTHFKAEMGRGETQTATYRMQGSSQGGETVTVRPYYSRLELIHEGEVAWSSSGGSGGVPPVVFVLPGTSIQSKVDASQRPDPGHYERVNIPEKIYDPAKKDGIGISTISSQGLTPRLK